MSYFKFSEPEVLAVFKARREAINDLTKKAKAFALQFAPESTVHFRTRPDFSFAGIVFTPRMDSLLWTKASPTSSNFQRPRATVSKATVEQKVAHKALVAMWDTGLPREQISIAPVFDAMGAKYDWFHGYHIFVRGDLVYLAGEYMPTKGVEILGSEFVAAEKQEQAA